ncbi:dimethylargininase [Aestuariimicrobium sp. Y1814]|uniref:dimethylargininase n=1 Tax=Aestuariimicrobium sp. Y1814 TaxID=3418742 RepID=UPI003DA71783
MSSTQRIQQPRRYLMCRPEHFAVSSEINPWMNRGRQPDRARALAQWQALHDTYLRLGHEVELIDPVPGLDDMVYTANAGLVIDGIALGARFAVAERRGEEPHFLDWCAAHGFDVVEPVATQEGEGDLMLVGDTILAGHGFRSVRASHDEVARVFGREVVSLRLVNPTYYHLDTALCVLDEETIAYLPAAFDQPSQDELAVRFPDAIRLPTPAPDALVVNATSDGRHVIIPPDTGHFEAELRERGYLPVPVDVSELHLGGGGIKCCTLELRGGRS